MSTNYDGGSVRPEPETASLPDQRPAEAGTNRRPRAGTMVWGLIILVLAAALILAELATFSVDPRQLIIGLLLGAGVVLVIAGLLSATSKKR